MTTIAPPAPAQAAEAIPKPRFDTIPLLLVAIVAGVALPVVGSTSVTSVVPRHCTRPQTLAVGRALHGPSVRAAT